MDYAGVVTNPNAEVLGWVNIDKSKQVIIKSNGSYYRAEFITKIEKEERGVQFPSNDGGYEWPILTNIRCVTNKGGAWNPSPNRDDAKNLELYENLVAFKRKTEIAGQIYY